MQSVINVAVEEERIEAERKEMKQEMKQMKDAARSGTKPALTRRASSKNLSRKASLTKQPSFAYGAAAGGR